MKKYLFISLIALCSIIMSCFSGSYTATPSVETTTVVSNDDAGLCEAVSGLREANTPEEIEAAAIVLATVAEQEPNNWLTNYHLARAYGRLAHTCAKSKDVDNWVEKGSKALQLAAQSAGADESEILIMEAYLGYAGIRVSPIMRGYTYSSAALAKVKSAYQVDKENPRSYLLISQHLLNTPAMFGGDAAKACEYIADAIKKFDAEEANTERDPLSPSWGRQDSEDIATNSCSDEATSKRK